MKKEKEEKKKKEDDLPEPNPFKVRVAGGTTLNPEKNIVFEFDYPLTGVDSAAMSLLKLGEGDQTTPVGLTFRQDTLKLRKWTLAAPWEADQKYRLLIPARRIQEHQRREQRYAAIRVYDRIARKVRHAGAEYPG